MFRKHSQTIKNWIQGSNKALLLTGARQTGKTWLIRDEVNKSDYQMFEINFIDRPDMIDYLNAEISAEDFLVRLRMIMPQEYQDHKTIIFFDEIQKCPEIVTKIKFLVDDGSFRYIMSGSLLGVELKGITSAPVGYLSVVTLHPMDFEEFMIANDVSDSTIEMLKQRYDTLEPIDDYIHERLLSLFFVYLIVGGMPDAIRTYILNKDIREVDRVQKDITALYKHDFTQYEHKYKKLKLNTIYDNIPVQLNKQNKKFVFTMLDKELKFDRYENSFLWLKDAGTVIPVYRVNNPVSPLTERHNTHVFRLFSSDTGLLTSAYPVETKMELIRKNSEVNNGAHFENAVAQQLLANGLVPYYCRKKNLGEIDFVVEIDGKVVLIEVKSGKDHHQHKALNSFMTSYAGSVDRGYVLSSSNIEKNGNIIYLPIYMTYLIKEKELEQIIVDIDLKGL